MRHSRPILPALIFAGLGLFCLLSVSAWFHVQSVRLTYRSHAIRQELDQLDRHEQAQRRSVESALSLTRLDAKARGRRGLVLPRPEQIHIFTES